jgi:hypothetical protein
MSVIVHNAVFWILIPCGLIGGFWCFGGTYWFHLEGEILQDDMVSQTLTMNAALSSEALVSVYKTTRWHNLEIGVQISDCGKCPLGRNAV